MSEPKSLRKEAMANTHNVFLDSFSNFSLLRYFNKLQFYLPFFVLDGKDEIFSPRKPQALTYGLGYDDIVRGLVGAHVPFYEDSSFIFGHFSTSIPNMPGILNILIKFSIEIEKKGPRGGFEPLGV